VYCDLPRTLHRNIPALDRDIRPARRRQADALGRCPVNMCINPNDIDLIASLQIQYVALRLQIYCAFRFDQSEPLKIFNICGHDIVIR
jgi:hypothetical protein